jgi:hypothetical protein
MNTYIDCKIVLKKKKNKLLNIVGIKRKRCSKRERESSGREPQGLIDRFNLSKKNKNSFVLLLYIIELFNLGGVRFFCEHEVRH